MKISSLAYTILVNYHLDYSIGVWRLLKDRTNRTNAQLLIFIFDLMKVFDTIEYDEKSSEFYLIRGDIRINIDKNYVDPNPVEPIIDQAKILPIKPIYLDELKNKFFFEVTQDEQKKIHPGSCLRMSTAGSIRSIIPKERNNFLG